MNSYIQDLESRIPEIPPTSKDRTKISRPSNHRGPPSNNSSSNLGEIHNSALFLTAAQPKQLQMTCDQLELHYRPQSLGELPLGRG